MNKALVKIRDKYYLYIERLSDNESIKDATEGYEMTGQIGTDIFTGETMIEYVKKT
jgi:hypothetical protein